MAVLSRVRIIDDGQSLQGRRGRAYPVVCGVVALLETGYGLTMLFEGSARGVLILLLGVPAATMGVTWGATAVVDDRGVRPLGRLRRIPWARITAVSRPNTYEGSVVVVLKDGRRLQTGFPADLLPRLTALGAKNNSGI